MTERKLIPIPNQSRKKKEKNMTAKKEETKTRKPREAKEKSPVRLAADAYDKIRSLKQDRQKVMDEAAAKHDAKISAVFDALTDEAKAAFEKLS